MSVGGRWQNAIYVCIIQIFVNPLCYLLLQAFHQNEQSANTTLTQSDALMHCGANDCQDPELVDENINKYVPNQAATFILLGSMILLCCIAVTLHICFLPSVKVFQFDESDSSSQNKKVRVFDLAFYNLYISLDLVLLIYRFHDLMVIYVWITRIFMNHVRQDEALIDA